MDCVERHLKYLLEGAVTAWDVVADVTASNDRPEAQVSAADGIAIQATCRPEE
jgi:molybdopterin biosynthesis enzyme